jgi:gamma-glutamyltranspeptidase/glutathione hydrolase
MRRNTRDDLLSRWGVLCALVATTLLAAVAGGNTAEGVHGMVASVQPLATEAGLATLRSGGNAIDAAVSVALTLGVVDGHNSGIGGGCFMLIHAANGQTVALDGREMAGAAATPTMFIRDGKGDTRLSQNGALASGVPGSLAVYSWAVEHLGRKHLADLLLPAADLAEKGFPLDRIYASKILHTRDLILQFPDTAAILLKPDRSCYTEGEILKLPDLAASYRAIAAGGPEWYYHGPFGAAVETWMKSHGGILTAADYAHYQMKLREPIVTRYRSYTIIGFPPPSSGGVHVAEILGILSHFDLAALQQQDPALRVHVTAEAMRLAFADRAHWLGDPDFVPVPRGLINPGYWATLANTIDLHHAHLDATFGTPPDAGTDVFGSDAASKHTTHIAVADDQGNWVALTTTLNTAFGSKVIIPGTGILMNDQMDDFAIQPGVPNAFHLVGGDANAPGPGKRPLSSMSPTIVLQNGRPMLTAGAAGGPKIITQVVLLLSNVIDLHDDLATALAAPRFHEQWSPPALLVEKTMPPAIIGRLKQLGQQLDSDDPSGATQAILRRENGTLVGANDPRVPGLAKGY